MEDFNSGSAEHENDLLLLQDDGDHVRRDHL